MKSSRLELRLEESDLTDARMLAQRHNTSVSSIIRLFIRSAASAPLDATPVIVFDKKTFSKYVLNVRALGHLYNQAVRALNTLAKIAREEGIEAQNLLEELELVSYQLNEVRQEAEAIRAQAGELTGRPAVFE